jgi:Protein of unknown function (DUF3168)
MSVALGALRAMLVADAAVIAAVPADRIVAGEIQQDTLWPVIALVHSSTQREGNLAVAVGEELLSSSIEVLPLAEGYAQMSSLVQLIEAACHGKRGMWGGVSVAQSLRVAQGQDDFFDEQGVWARPVVFQLIYTRP